MRVFFSDRSGAVIAASVATLNATALRLREFVESPQSMLVLPTAISGSPEPYEAFLPGVCLEKCEGPVLVALDDEFGLRVTGSPHNLAIWCASFSFPDNAGHGAHHHLGHVFPDTWLNPRSLPVIVEVSETENHAP